MIEIFEHEVLAAQHVLVSNNKWCQVQGDIFFIKAGRIYKEE